MIFADKITALRKKNGWSQEELAEKVGISRQTLSKYETGEAVPDIDILDIGASTSGWSNIPDYDFYYKIGNPKRQHHFELESQEEVTMDLPYLFAKPNFRNGQWKKIEGKEYFLVTSLYPIKHMVKI